MAVVSVNRVDYPLAVFAAWLCGASVNLLDPCVGREVLEEQLRLVPARMVVTTPRFLDKVSSALLRISHLGTVVFLYDTEAGGAATMDDDLVLARIVEGSGSAAANLVPCPSTNMDDLSATLWSSGSTGKSKGIQLAFRTWHRNLGSGTNKGIQSALVPWVNSSPTFNYVLGTWMFHIGGFYFSLYNIGRGQVVFIHPDQMSPSLVLATVDQYKSNPVMLSFHDIVQLSNTAPDGSLDLSSVDSILPLGSSVPVNTQSKLQRLFPNLKRMAQAYGATEVGGLVTFTVDEQYSDSMGPALVNTKVLYPLKKFRP